MSSTIVALTDFSPAGDACLERAASLAARQRWLLQIMYVAEKNQPIEPGPLARLALCSLQLARRYNTPVEAASQIVVSEARLIDATSSAQCVVTGSGEDAVGGWFWRDSVVDQLMRNCHCPILVVKNAQEAPYKRVLVGVDFSEGSMELVSRACELVPDAEVHLLHVIGRSDEAKLRSSEASIDAIKAYRRQVNAKAERRLSALAKVIDAHTHRIRFFVGHGDAALQTSVQQEAVSADLIVVGKQRRSAFREMFFGSVTRRIVRLADSDVLIVPQRADHMFVATGQEAVMS